MAGPDSGYAHADYARSFVDLGETLELPRCGGAVIVRPVPGTDGAGRDAMGPYPVFSCRDWTKLAADLEDPGADLVALSLVTDPFGNWSEESLATCFPDRLVPFKEHFVTDLTEPPESTVSSHHRRYSRKSLRELEVEICPDPSARLDEWCGLYDQLIERHGITGVPAFSRESFARQLEVPGLVMVRAGREGRTVGIVLWYEQGDAAFYHLAAYDEEGYRRRASFAAFWTSIEHFRERVRWLGLGASAGTSGDADDGLARFKRGWATGTRQVHFCGRIFRPERYAELVRAAGREASRYFPAYREGEFRSGNDGED